MTGFERCAKRPDERAPDRRHGRVDSNSIRAQYTNLTNKGGFYILWRLPGGGKKILYGDVGGGIRWVLLAVIMWFKKVTIPETVGISMKEHQISRALLALGFALATLTMSGLHAQTLDEVLGVRQATTQDGRKSQSKIDEIKEDTRDLLTQYKQVMKIVDGLKIYNLQQERLIRNQETEMADLNQSIDNVTIIERQIGPLIQRMIDNLEKFVELDLPFLKTERAKRIEFLKDALDRADVSVAEKFSQVLQAYQVENTYGTTIEAYSDFVDLNGASRQVDMLKWGRIALVFQTSDGEITGAWDNKARKWEILPDKFRAGVRDGIRIARKTMTADFVTLPIPAPERK